MSNLRLVCAAVVVFAAAVSFTAGASADPKTGCPAAEGYDAYTIDAAAAAIFPKIIPPSPFQTVEELAASLDATFDKNDDGMICLKIFKGDDLNPNSKWYILGVDLLGSPTSFLIPRDNTANATKA